MAHNIFAPVGNAFRNAGETFALAREMQSIYNTPEAAFRARGTTRDAAIRKLIAKV